MSKPSLAPSRLLCVFTGHGHACAAVSDWSIHCALRYEEQGVWGVLSALVSCSPWVLGVFLLSFYHTCWSSTILLVQLYQVRSFPSVLGQRVGNKYYKIFITKMTHKCPADRFSGTNHGRADESEPPPEETPIHRFSETESIQVSDVTEIQLDL